MSPRQYKTKFFVDPSLYPVASNIVSRMGSNFVLEGAIDIGGGDMRIWVRDTSVDRNKPTFFCKIFPLGLQLEDVEPVNVEPVEPVVVPKIENKHDDDFLIIKKT